MLTRKLKVGRLGLLYSRDYDPRCPTQKIETGVELSLAEWFQKGVTTLRIEDITRRRLKYIKEHFQVQEIMRNRFIVGSAEF